MTRKVDPRVGWVTLARLPRAVAVVLAIGFLARAPDLPRHPRRDVRAPGRPRSCSAGGPRRPRSPRSRASRARRAAALNMLRKGWTVTPGGRGHPQPGPRPPRRRPARRRADRRGLRPAAARQPAGAREEEGRALRARRARSTTSQAGNDEGQVPLRKLNRHLMKLPRNLRTAPGRPRSTAGSRRSATHDPADPQGPDAEGHPDAERPARRLTSAGGSADRTSTRPGGPVVQAAPVAVPDQRRDRAGSSSTVRSSARAKPTRPPSSRDTHPGSRAGSLTGGRRRRTREHEHLEREDRRRPDGGHAEQAPAMSAHSTASTRTAASRAPKPATEPRPSAGRPSR